jgi:hypothetical protein
MGWEAGVEFTMMEKSVKAEWSGLRSFPPYGTGNTHNTWYACSMVDAQGRAIPWVDRDGTVLKTVSARYRPAQGQRFFLKGGGESDFPHYDTKGPDIMPVDELLKRGYKLPFFADLPSMPELERKAIWGLMVGQEGKTKVPILENYTKAGFDPTRDLLQSYGDGWKSGSFLPQERQLFGLPGGMVNDWELRTNLDGLYAAGDQLFASNCHGHAAATGHYAGRHASRYASEASLPEIESSQVEEEKKRILSLVDRDSGMGWKELNAGIARIMQNYCGEVKSEELLTIGLKLLKDIALEDTSKLHARNPHELVRCLEVLNIMTNAEPVLHSCLARQASSKHLHFRRQDYPEIDPPDWHKFVTIKSENGEVITGELSLDYYGSLEENYSVHNGEYLNGDQR